MNTPEILESIGAVVLTIVGKVFYDWFKKANKKIDEKSEATEKNLKSYVNDQMTVAQLKFKSDYQHLNDRICSLEEKIDKIDTTLGKKIDNIESLIASINCVILKLASGELPLRNGQNNS